LIGTFIGIYFEIQTEHINALCGENAEALTVTAVGTHTYHRALNILSVYS
jgi:hypothetical protein